MASSTTLREAETWLWGAYGQQDADGQRVVDAALTVLEGIRHVRQAGARAQLRAVRDHLVSLAQHDREIAAAVLLLGDLVGAPAAPAVAAACPVVEVVPCHVEMVRGLLPAPVPPLRPPGRQLLLPAVEVPPIVVECYRRGRAVKVRVLSEGFEPSWHCTFPPTWRADGARFLVRDLGTVPPIRGRRGQVLRRGFYQVKRPIWPLCQHCQRALATERGFGLADWPCATHCAACQTRPEVHPA